MGDEKLGNNTSFSWMEDLFRGAASGKVHDVSQFSEVLWKFWLGRCKILKLPIGKWEKGSEFKSLLDFVKFYKNSALMAIFFYICQCPGNEISTILLLVKHIRGISPSIFVFVSTKTMDSREKNTEKDAILADMVGKHHFYQGWQKLGVRPFPNPGCALLCKLQWANCGSKDSSRVFAEALPCSLFFVSKRGKKKRKRQTKNEIEKDAQQQFVDCRADNLVNTALQQTSLPLCLRDLWYCVRGMYFSRAHPDDNRHTISTERHWEEYWTKWCFPGGPHCMNNCYPCKTPTTRSPHTHT